MSKPMSRDYGFNQPPVELQRAPELDKNVLARMSDELLEQNAGEWVHRVETTLGEKPKLLPTALPAVRLALFNYIGQHPLSSQEEVAGEYARLSKLSDQEKQYANPLNPLPTIGIEQEVPLESFTPARRQVLELLQIPQEKDGNNWEVNPDFSYSPWVPARVLQELAVLGAVPYKEDESGRVWVAGEPLPLHINFGLPAGYDWPTLSRQYPAQMHTLSDSFAYAFSSSQRIKSQEFATAIKVKNEAKPSAKQKNGSMPLALLELRALEFKDYPTFRLLAESQLCVAALAAYITSQEHEAQNGMQAELAEVWAQFYEAAARLSAGNIGHHANFMDTKAEQSLELAEWPGFRESCRKLITQCATRARSIIADVV